MPATQTDVLGAPYEVETFALPPDDEGPVVATLVKLPTLRYRRGAVLHLHGFADYFFHTEYAEWWAARGYDFYALDLRKYGRSLLPHQTPNFMTDLSEYYPEIDLSWWRIVQRDANSKVIISAHSTGGLTAALWADERRPAELAGLVLNSPWLDMQGAAWLRTPAARAALNQLGARQPKRVIPREVSGLYGRSLHRTHGGEWDFDLTWKPLDSRPVHVGWLRGIRRGHAKVHAGLDIRCPVLVLSSERSHQGAMESLTENVRTSDIVLDVEQIRRWASSLGQHVTSLAITDAVHDVILSRPEVRTEVYARLRTWLDAWLE